MLLYQESQGTSHPLDLNAPISEYLHNTPSFKLPRKWAGVTTMELLNMSSGIGNGPSNQPWQAQVASIANAPLLFHPGTKTFYSDTNFDLLGELIQQWTGEKYGTFIQNQILEPLGMSETQELGRSPTVRNQAVGYDTPRHGSWPKAAVENGLEMYAAAGMVSTAQDMASYMTALLSGQLLDPATYSLMWTSTPTPQYGLNPPLGLRARAGLGYGDPCERRARHGRQGWGRFPDSSLSSSFTLGRTVEFLSRSTPILAAIGVRATSLPCRWPKRCTWRPRLGQVRGGDEPARSTASRAGRVSRFEPRARTPISAGCCIW